MTYRSGVPKVKRRLNSGVEKALLAMAQIGVNHMKQVIPPNYYTGGKYAKGHLKNSILAGRPYTDEQGRRAIKYGVDRSALYALFWEIGHWAYPALFLGGKIKKWISLTGDRIFRRTKKDGTVVEVRPNPRNVKIWRKKAIWVPEFIKLRSRFEQAFNRVVAKELGK